MRYFKLWLGLVIYLVPSIVLATATFTLDEVAQHNTLSDCYQVISGKVYNVSTYANAHPGGRETLASGCGKDVTTEFAQIHSDRAYQQLNQFYIGDLSSTNSQVKVNNPVVPDQLEIGWLTKLQQNPYILPILAVWLIVVLGHWGLRRARPQKCNILGLRRIISLVMLVSFILVAFTGVCMLLFGRMIGSWSLGDLHNYSGWLMVLVGVTHVWLHRKELVAYLKKYIGK